MLNFCNLFIILFLIFSRVIMYFFLKLIYRFNFEVGLVKFVELIFIVKFLDIEVVIYINFDI